MRIPALISKVCLDSCLCFCVQQQGQSQLSRPIHVVVSLGTGRLPLRSINACDVFRPEGLFDLAQVALGAKNLGELLIDQVLVSLVIIKCYSIYLGIGRLILF